MSVEQSRSGPDPDASRPFPETPSTAAPARASVGDRLLALAEVTLCSGYPTPAGTHRALHPRRVRPSERRRRAVAVACRRAFARRRCAGPASGVAAAAGPRRAPGHGLRRHAGVQERGAAGRRAGPCGAPHRGRHVRHRDARRPLAAQRAGEPARNDDAVTRRRRLVRGGRRGVRRAPRGSATRLHPPALRASISAAASPGSSSPASCSVSDTCSRAGTPWS